MLHASPTRQSLHSTEAKLLSQRELQCLQRLASGLANSGIARSLGISEPTVAMHISNARRKLGASTRIQAVALAVRHGLIDPHRTFGLER